MTDEKKQEFTFRISNANSTQLVVILYDILLTYIDEAKTAYDTQKKEECTRAINNIRRTMNELIASLNLKYQPAPTLLGLYAFCVRRLTECEMKGSDECFDEIKNIIAPLRRAYDEISVQNKGGSVMNNSQTVYAGLTYGKNSLTENVTDKTPNRGMLA